MSREIAVVFYYHKSNRFSINALVGAIESREDVANTALFFPSKPPRLFQSLKDALEHYQSVIVGISFSTPQVWEITKIVKSLRKEQQNRVILIAGGPHPTALPKSTLNMGFDVIVRGEGEIAFPELLSCIKYRRPYKDVEGLCVFNGDGTFRANPRPPPIDLNNYPPFSKKYFKIGSIEITRGCPFACYFCQTSTIFGTEMRHRTVKNVCKYTKILKKRMPDNGRSLHMRFITPNGFLYGSKDGKINYETLKDLLKNVRNIIGPEGKLFLGSFPSEVRPENVNHRTLDLLTTYCDNDKLIMGAQSGSNEVLKACHRGHTVEDVKNAVELCEEYSLVPEVDFIFGLPKETPEDVEKTINLMEFVAQKEGKIHAHTFIPLPGTVFHHEIPRKLDKSLVTKIEYLTGKEKLYGTWRKQEKMAREICNKLQDIDEKK